MICQLAFTCSALGNFYFIHVNAFVYKFTKYRGYKYFAYSFSRIFHKQLCAIE